MGEALFGLIMTLTFTLGVDLIIHEQGREGARQMLIGILGCNLEPPVPVSAVQRRLKEKGNECKMHR
jgi:hypothetical protein